MSPEDIKKIREEFEFNKLDSIALLEPVCEALLDEVERCQARLKVAEDALEDVRDNLVPSTKYPEWILAARNCAVGALKKIRKA